MKIFGNPVSTCTRKVLMTLDETGTPYEFVLVDFAKGEHKAPPHVARQPFGQVPALDDDGFQMFESRAMCRYIDQKAGNKLVPTDARTRARVEQWMSVEVEDFTPHTMKFVLQHVFQRPQEAAVLESAAKRVETALGVLDTQLAKHPYLAGEQFSLADVTFMPYVEYGMATPLKDSFAKHRSFSDWWHRISERASWRKVAGRA